MSTDRRLKSESGFVPLGDTPASDGVIPQADTRVPEIVHCSICGRGSSDYNLRVPTDGHRAGWALCESCLQKHAAPCSGFRRLIAATVPNNPKNIKRSDDASANELGTAIAGAEPHKDCKAPHVSLSTKPMRPLSIEEEAEPAKVVTYDAKIGTCHKCGFEPSRLMQRGPLLLCGTCIDLERQEEPADARQQSDAASIMDAYGVAIDRTLGESAAERTTGRHEPATFIGNENHNEPEHVSLLLAWAKAKTAIRAFADAELQARLDARKQGHGERVVRAENAREQWDAHLKTVNAAEDALLAVAGKMGVR